MSGATVTRYINIWFSLKTVSGQKVKIFRQTIIMKPCWCKQHFSVEEIIKSRTSLRVLLHWYPSWLQCNWNSKFYSVDSFFTDFRNERFRIPIARRDFRHCDGDFFLPLLFFGLTEWQHLWWELIRGKWNTRTANFLFIVSLPFDIIKWKMWSSILGFSNYEDLYIIYF